MKFTLKILKYIVQYQHTYVCTYNIVHLPYKNVHFLAIKKKL